MAHRLRELVLWAGAALGLLAVATGLAVAFFGFSFLVFRSGSMEPEISTGGLALSRTVAADDIRTGDVVSVIASTGERITHRVVSATVRDGEASLVLKGDANATADSEVYVVSSAERVVFDVPFAGYAAAHILTPPGLLAVACLGLMLVVVGFGRDDAAVAPRRQARAPRKPRRVRVGAVRRPAHAVTALAMSVALVGAVLGADEVSGTLARFTDPAKAASSSFGAAKYFTCDAAVRGSGNLYLYWKFDETTSTTAADSSGNNRTGVLSGGATLSTRACARDTGGAVTLNGTNSVINQTTNTAVPGPNVFTVSIWFKTTTTAGGKLIGFGNARTGPSGQYDRHLYMTNNGKLVFGVYPGSAQTVTSPASYNDGAWHQAVARLSSTGMRLFVDGASVASNAAVTTGESYQGFWRVGYDNIGGWPTVPASQYFGGTVDDFAVYQTAVSDADIAASYAAG